MKSNFKDRFSVVLNDRNMSMADVAKITGISRSSLSEYAKGKFVPKQDKVYLISKALDVSPAWLMGFDVDIDNHKKNEATFVGRANVMRTYRYIDSKVSAGTPIAIDGQNYSSLAVPDSMLGKYAKEDVLFMHISGDSMNKIIPNGSLIGILEYNSIHDIKNGDIVVFDYNGNYSVKRFYKDEEQNRIIFKPESTDPTYLDIVYDLELNNVDIIGKVIMYNVTLE